MKDQKTPYFEHDKMSESQKRALISSNDPTPSNRFKNGILGLAADPYSNDKLRKRVLSNDDLNSNFGSNLRSKQSQSPIREFELNKSDSDIDINKQSRQITVSNKEHKDMLYLSRLQGK